MTKFAMIKTPTKIHDQNWTWISFLTKLDIRIFKMNSCFVSDWVSLKFCGSKYFNLLKSYCMFKFRAKFSWVFLIIANLANFDECEKNGLDGTKNDLCKEIFTKSDPPRNKKNNPLREKINNRNKFLFLEENLKNRSMSFPPKRQIFTPSTI